MLLVVVIIVWQLRKYSLNIIFKHLSTDDDLVNEKLEENSVNSSLLLDNNNNEVEEGIMLNENVNDNNNHVEVCVICQVNPRDILFRPCKHLCVCNKCDNFMISATTTTTLSSFSQCPVCRCTILERERVCIP